MSDTFLGLDRSGNDNNWTVTNMTLAADQMVDSPTNNFCTMNPNLGDDDAGIYSEGNLYVRTSTTHANERGTFGVTSGKWYWEVVLITADSPGYPIIGVCDTDGSIAGWGAAFNRSVYSYTGNKYSGSSNSSYTDAYAVVGNILMFALDMDNGKWWFGKNGTWAESGDPANGTSATHDDLLTAATDSSPNNSWSPYIDDGSGSGVNDVVFNFGQDSSFAGNKTAQGNQDDNSIGDFYYDVPANYLALCTSNLPAVAVTPSEHFNTILYDDGAGAKTGVGFQPDLVWVKSRGSAYEHELTDAIRGVTKAISSDSDNIESTDSTGLTAFGADGFTVGADTNYADTTGDGMVAWNWKGGNATLGTGDFTQGAIASTCSRNVDAGFSIVSWTGTGSANTIGHGLSVKPNLILAKQLDNGSAGWRVFHDKNTAAPETDHLVLNSNAATTDSDAIWNDTEPTSSLFTVGTGGSVNASGTAYIAYCFHSVDGFSKVGSYTGNGDADGTFVYTGFRPAFVMIKNTTLGSWHTFDSVREPTNDGSMFDLMANSSSVELTQTTNDSWDALSNGFKMRGTNNESNGSGQTIVYMAFAETPFKYSNAR